MRKIRIDFCDSPYPNSSKRDNFLFKLLSERFDVDLCDQPDFLIYGTQGFAHRLHSGVRIFFSGESEIPNFDQCDYSIASAKVEDPRHLQLPHYVTYGDPQEIIKKQDDPAKILAGKKKFCSFVIGAYNRRKTNNRVDFFHRLSKYKKVDSGGRLFNNINGAISGGSRGKIDFLQQYKFNIAFENRSLVGYTTEKIFEPMVARCLPLYWGNPLINAEFNPRSFLNLADFPNEDAFIEKIIELDNDDAKYLEYLRQPYFHDDKPNLFFDRQRILDFFEQIFSRKITPVAQRKQRSIFGRWMAVKRHHWHPAKPPSWQD